MYVIVKIHKLTYLFTILSIWLSGMCVTTLSLLSRALISFMDDLFAVRLFFSFWFLFFKHRVVQIINILNIWWPCRRVFVFASSSAKLSSLRIILTGTVQLRLKNDKDSYDDSDDKKWDVISLNRNRNN